MRTRCVRCRLTHVLLSCGMCAGLGADVWSAVGRHRTAPLHSGCTEHAHGSHCRHNYNHQGGPAPVTCPSPEAGRRRSRGRRWHWGGVRTSRRNTPVTRSRATYCLSKINSALLCGSPRLLRIPPRTPSHWALQSAARSPVSWCNRSTHLRGQARVNQHCQPRRRSATHKQRCYRESLIGWSLPAVASARILRNGGQWDGRRALVGSVDIWGAKNEMWKEWKGKRTKH